MNPLDLAMRVYQMKKERQLHVQASSASLLVEQQEVKEEPKSNTYMKLDMLLVKAVEFKQQFLFSRIPKYETQYEHLGYTSPSKAKLRHTYKLSLPQTSLLTAPGAQNSHRSHATSNHSRRNSQIEQRSTHHLNLQVDRNMFEPSKELVIKPKKNNWDEVEALEIRIKQGRTSKTKRSR